MTRCRPTRTVRRRQRPRRFLRMAWLANPFAYIAINTLIAVMPGHRREISHLAHAGGICLFAVVFRPARHVCACCGGGRAGITASAGWSRRLRCSSCPSRPFSCAPNLAVLIAAQIFFGGAIGLIYYSSLFYSMDASDTKSEHGGIHEAAIGLGNCIGPAVRRGGACNSCRNTRTAARSP